MNAVMAQATVTPAPVLPGPAIVAPVVQSGGGILGWVAAHGGFQAAILLVVGAAMTLLSAFRSVLAAYDGVAQGAAIPENMVGLTKLNKICLILGKIVDFLQGNVQH